jgi:hypothetical protein
MRKFGILSAIALLVLVNIIVLAGVARNRSGAPDAVVELTERELPLGFYRSSADRENTGISLRLDWNQYPVYSKVLHRNNRGLKYDWFDQAKLEEVGFVCSVPLTDSKAELYYEKMLPRKAYAVLEYEGLAWDAWREREQQDLSEIAARAKRGAATQKDLKEAQKEYERELKTHSRLFAVDAGSDPGKLRQRYPDNKHYLIVPAKVRLSYNRNYNEETKKYDRPTLTGYLSEILVDDIHVPKTMRSVLDALAIKGKSQTESYYSYDMNKQEPRYKVALYYGKRYEPWVAGIEPIVQ